MESNRLVISKNNIFIGKRYVSDGLFKLNVAFEISNVTPKIFFVESCDVWHRRLGDVSLNKIKKMIDFDIIPKSHVDFKHKCQICVQFKQPRKSFKAVNRNSQILEVIQSDVCNYNKPSIRAGNKYFVTFIDDCSEYCYVYLVKTKMKFIASSKFKKLKLKIN